MSYVWSFFLYVWHFVVWILYLVTTTCNSCKMRLQLGQNLSSCSSRVKCTNTVTTSKYLISIQLPIFKRLYSNTNFKGKAILSNTAPHAMQSGANLGELGGGGWLQNTPLPPKKPSFKRETPPNYFSRLIPVIVIW